MKLLGSIHSVFLFLLISTSFLSCSPGPAKRADGRTTNDSLSIKYSTGFSIRYFPHYKQVNVNSPWAKGAIYARYYLVVNRSIVTPGDGIKVQVPLKTLASSSVTHFEFLRMLGELETVKGICSAGIIYNTTLRQRVSEGKVTDLGDAFHINLEKVLQLKPQALMMSGYNQNDPNALRIIQAGVPVIYNNEWMETSLLGRAEWIKFVAAFYNKEQLADSLFQTIENRYNDIKSKAAKVKDKPNVMAGSNFRGTWYMPAGRSFMGHLFADAGTRYYFAGDTTTGSLPLNVETVLKNFSRTDVWLNCNFSSLNDLLNADTKHGLFKPVIKKQVYNFNKRMLPSGANDFWESAIARPDLILADVIAILHPEILPNYQLFYAEKLK